MDVGLYGKLPTHGDFLRRRVSDEFVAAWDAWLQLAIADSRSALGDRWLEIYLTSPIWRFALCAGICGEAPMAGLLAPSVDRVGRYFPLTLVWTTPRDCNSLEVADRYEHVFGRGEQLLVESLALESLEFADFDRRVCALADELEAPEAEGPLRLRHDSVATLLAQPDQAWRVPLRTVAALRLPATQVIGDYWQQSFGAGSLWWTDGSALVEPSWLIARGLPEPNRFSAMLDGEWKVAGWNVALAEIQPPTTKSADLVPTGPACASSAALTDPGPVRSSNQDAFLERSDLGIWAVADGIGGLSQGELASRMVCDSLVDVRVVSGLEEQIEAVVEQLRQVNEYLRRGATRLQNPVHSGSTVVVLVIRDKECAVIWAGDSRAYRFRDGLLSQMSTDHSWSAGTGTQDETAADSTEQAITRAVGAEDSLLFDVVRSDVRARDRYLLCSDGVARVLDIGALAGILQHGEAKACCAELISQALAQGATDNVTAVVVDCALPMAEELLSGPIP